MFIEALSKSLRFKPLNQWYEHASAISSYRIFGDGALELVTKSLQDVMTRAEILLD
jgi:hypothetical protein